MNVVIATLYGFVIWLSTVLYALIAAPSLAGIALAMMPITVSGSVAVILAIDILLEWAWKSVARILPERAQRPGQDA